MSDELYRQLNARLDDVSRRLDDLQKTVDTPKKPWYKPTTPGELVTFIGIPAALLGALWTFYDEFWLKLKSLDAATTAMAQEKLTELQDLRAEIFVLQARENDDEIAAILEAKNSRRDRLVTESFVYWNEQPSYFTKKETMLLAEELQLQQRQLDALTVIADIQPAGAIENADMERFKGSLYGAEGAAQSLEAARKHFKSALSHAQEHVSVAGQQQLQAKISFSWLYTELSNRTGCEHSGPVAELLALLLEDDPDKYNLGILDGNARELLEIQAERCD